MTRDVIQLDRALGLNLLHTMMRIRAFEARCAELARAGRIRGPLPPCDGEEAVAAGVMRALTEKDSVVVSSGEHGHALARGVPMGPLMAELFGRAEGTCRGRGGALHIFDRARRFHGGNANVGSGMAIAIGVALADKLQATGAVTACFFGRTAAEEGVFHECLNLAALWSLPVLFVCENDMLGKGASAAAATESAIWRKAAGYGIPAEVVDGMDVLATAVAARRAVGQLRMGNGPQLLECRTGRVRSDAQECRPASLSAVAGFGMWGDDPVLRLCRRLAKEGAMAAHDMTLLEAEATAEVEDAVAFAEAGTLEPFDELDRFVTMDTVPL
ncbi:MAG: thiamine pyrophosphate-dependent dehydrogenase E1 component subunit alpha [Acetobacteraceae bacterium]|nr:thiamine pyrophosphate-dependent dehydrogenase E1 component subunit alpha [Acetobacteraceae bacterium]